MIDLHARSFELYGGIFRREPQGNEREPRFIFGSISKLE